MSASGLRGKFRSTVAASALILGCPFIMAANSSVGSKLPAPAARPVIEGPIAGVPLVHATGFDLAKVGYQQSEYFISGKARSFVNTTPLQSDGKWDVKVADQADFKTRFVVFRPTDAAKFNGTVIFEWLNVSGGSDAAPDWVMTHTELIRKGYAWVGVSAQKAGIDGGGFNMTGLTRHLKAVNAQRYNSLAHPGDSFSFDMFSQAARAVLHPNGVDPLAGLGAKYTLAVGESQSAFYLTTYLNALAPRMNIFDGYFIHSRGGSSAKLSQSPQADVEMPKAVFVRNDLRTPVMMLQTETDLLLLGSYASRQPDSEKFRLWEIAGTAHADFYVLKGPADLGDDPKIATVVAVAAPQPGIIECPKPINSGPQHFVAKAALAALDSWVRNGVAPAHANRLEVAGDPPALVRDNVGNARGGVRTPYVDAPIATLSGYGQDANASRLCSLFGTTVLFDRETLAKLYPNQEAYVAAVNKSVDSAVASTLLLKPDGDLIKAWAQASDIGKRQ